MLARGEPAGPADDRAHERAGSPLGADGRRGAEARGGRRAGRRRDEDVRQLARCGRAHLRDDDRRRARARGAAARARSRSRRSSSGRAYDVVVDREPRPGTDGGTVIARGINYGTSFEIALKIRELSGLLFEAYSAADLMHGPVAAIAPGWPVVAVAPSGPALGEMRSGDRGSRRAAAPTSSRSPTTTSLPKLRPRRCRSCRRPGVAEPARRRRAGTAARDAARPCCAVSISTIRSACRR